MRIILEYTELIFENPVGDAKKGMSVPGEVSLEQVQKIDYGNYGDENHRHHWPHVHDELGLTSPVLIIYTKDFGRIVVTGAIKFCHYPD